MGNTNTHPDPQKPLVESISRNNAVLQSLPRSTSIKVGAVSDLSSHDAEKAEIHETRNVFTTATTTTLVSDTSEEKQVQPTSSEQPKGAVTNNRTYLTDDNHSDLVENFIKELFGKILSDVVDEAVRAKQPRGESYDVEELEENASRSVASPALIGARGSVLTPKGEEPTETDSPPDSESPPDTAGVSLSLVPSLFTVENVRGLIVDVPHRIQPIIRQALDYLWQARMSASEGSRESALKSAANMPPTIFSFDFFEEADLASDVLELPNVRFINRQLLLDLVYEFMRDIYAGEDEEFALKKAGKLSCPRVSSHQFRLWQGHCRPTDKEHVFHIVASRLQEVLGFRTDKMVPYPEDINDSSDLRHFTGKLCSGTRFSRLTQWTLSTKSYLDRLLELELRADESSWLSYVPEEQRIKELLSDQIWDELVQEALNSMLNLWRNTTTSSSSVPNIVVVT